MKRIISVLLALVVLSSLFAVFSVSSAHYMIGDLDGDGMINMIDSIQFRRHLVGDYFLEDSRVADINRDGKISVLDALCLMGVFSGSYIIVQPGDDTVDISAYTVVIPEEATVYETYAAEILCDWVFDNCGVTLTTVNDTSDETEYEILIGNTSRDESNTGAEFLANQYLLKADGTKIVMAGCDYTIGSSVGELTYNKMDGSKVLFESISSDDTVMDYTPVEGDNVILMIGDGMGYNQIAYTAFYLKRRDPSYKGFIAESFPVKGDCTTYCLGPFKANYTFDKIVTDSAAAATALSSGWKTQKGYLGLNGYGIEIKNIREVAYDLGYKTAVLSTEPTTGATPSGFTVHTNSRSNAQDIIDQQAALVANGEITYLKGDIQDNLLNETKTALDLVSTDSDGFFVMIEEAYIDKACHKIVTGEYTKEQLVSYVLRFNTAIQYAATFAASRPDTVLIVTADHETGSLTATGGTSSGDHSNANVPIFAMGYGTEYFSDITVDNVDIARFMAGVYGIDSFGGDYSNINDNVIG